MLDGFRGLALIAVLGYHVFPSKVTGGFLGVEAFFVLSGYLLTALLLEEAGRSGKIDRKAYAARRLRRIAPALLVLLLGLAVAGPYVAPGDVFRLRGDVISSLLGVTNWRLIQDGSSYFTQIGRPPLVRHLWSIAVEVQFYLICPLLVSWILSRRRFSAIASMAGGMAFSALLMALLYSSPDPSRVYYGTDTRLGALLAGVLLAILLGYRICLPPDPEPGIWLQRSGMLGLAVLALLVLFADQSGRFMYPAGFLLAQIATMLVIAAGLRRGAVAKFLDRIPLRWLGERSYGIYLWHWPAVALLRPGVDIQWPPAVTAAVSIVIAVALGALSYTLIELPWLPRWRPRHAAPRKVHPVMRPALVLLAVAPIVLLAMRLPTSNPIAESLREGQRVVARQQRESALLLTAVPGAGGALAAARTDPAAPPAGGRAVTAIGDSVMVGAAAALQERLGPLGFVEAKLRRQFSEGLRVVQELRQQNRLGEVTIVHLGNNGPIKPAQMDALMGELSGAQNVLLVNVRVGRPWADSVNRTLKDAVVRHPRARIVDWHGFSAGHPEWFHSDGNHLKPTGARAFADAIAGVLATLPPAPAATAARAISPQTASAPPAAPVPPAEPATIILGARPAA